MLAVCPRYFKPYLTSRLTTAPFIVTFPISSHPAITVPCSHPSGLVTRDLTVWYAAPVNQQKDTIPRLQQLVRHMRDQLIGLRDGATFEEVRLRYIATVDKLVAEGLGRRTVSRVDDREAYWSPAADILQECIRLGFVHHRRLPSARRYLEGYRNKQFELTPTGQEVADSAQNDLGIFYDRLASAVIQAHPYFKHFLVSLSEAPLVCPEVSEGDVEAGRRQEKGTDHWARLASERLNAGPSSQTASLEAVRQEMGVVVRRRFGNKPLKKPPSKALSEALNDAFATVSLRARGLPMGATELKMLRAWGSQLRLIDQSRHIPDFEGSNVLWLAAELDESAPDLNSKRRSISERGAAVASAVVAAYRNQASSDESTLAAPYIPIYKVRAEAAFKCRVTRALVDIVLEQLANGEYSELGVQVWLHLGRGDQPPPSEPVYRRGGSRRYEITMTNKKGDR